MMTNGTEGAEEADRTRLPSCPVATVCFIRRNAKVLLQERAAGRVWAGRLNGPGGKVAAGETPIDAIVREVLEETQLHIIDPKRHGVLDLVFGEPERSRLAVVVFSCDRFAGSARGGREGRLRWYPEDRLPFDRLWPDMRYWLPTVLDGGTTTGVCTYDEDGDQLLSCSLQLEWERA
jgi:8-oxo-dGTP diphosphatase